MTGPGPVSAPTPLSARRSPTLRAFLLFVVLFFLLFAAEIFALFYHPIGVPSAARDDRPRLIGEIAGPAVVAQTFELRTGGFNGVTVEAQAFAKGVDGNVVFSVSEIGRGRAGGAAAVRPGDTAAREVARVAAPAREVVAADTFTVRFAAVDESKGRQYRLEISAPGAPPGNGIGLWATRDQAYRGGILLVDGKEQWGDLVFRAHAERDTLFRSVEYMLRDKPAWVRSRWTLGTLIVVYNWALAAFTWYMLFVEDEAGEDDVVAEAPVAAPPGGDV